MATDDPPPPDAESPTRADALHDSVPLGAEPETDARPLPGRGPLPRGSTVNRYLILGVLGEGGMGRVYDAYDPQLDRRLALKLMLVGGDELNKQRLLREARAMAKLSHSCVVAVHDAGEEGDQVYVAMDLIEGTTLGKWVRQTKPPMSEVLTAFRRAGRGLAAAHAVGLVHRDFKPANVLLGAGGRVAVTDFGLAREVDSKAPDTNRDLAAIVDGSLKNPDSRTLEPLTRAGVVSGTPQYMAPEQFIAQAVDARADQFAYCVAMWDALYGKPPFPADSVQELVAKVTRGDITQPTDRKKVPAHIHRALERGLSVRPEHRFASMDDLLKEIAHDTGRGQRRLRWGAIAALSLTVLGLGWYRLSGARTRACGESWKRFEAVWTPPARQATREAFKTALPSHGAETFVSVESAFDYWVGTWKTAHRGICGAQGPGGSLFDNRVERQLGCLDELRLQGNALVSALGRVDRDSALAASEAVLALGLPEKCASEQALAVAPSGPRSQVRGRVVESTAFTSMLKSKEGEAKALEAVELAHTANLPDEESRAWLQVSLARSQTTRLDEAEDATVEAILAAERAGEQRDVGFAWVERMSLAALYQAQWAKALEAGRHAEVASDRVGGDPFITLRVQALRGQVLLQTGHPVEALAPIRRAVAMSEKAVGKKHFALVRQLLLLTNAARAAGELDEALAAIDRAIQIQGQMLPATHPARSGPLNARGRVLLSAGRLDEALAAHLQAQALIEGAFPRAHPEAIKTVAMIAECQRRKGDHAAARASFKDALSRASATTPKEHPLRATLERDVGAEALLSQDFADAAQSFERALAGPWSQPDRAKLNGNLAQARLGLKDWPASVAAAQASLEQIDSADTRFVLARAEWELGQKDLARADASKAKGAAEPLLATEIGRWLQAPPAPARPQKTVKPKRR